MALSATNHQGQNCSRFRLSTIDFDEPGCSKAKTDPVLFQDQILIFPAASTAGIAYFHRIKPVLFDPQPAYSTLHFLTFAASADRAVDYFRLRAQDAVSVAIAEEVFDVQCKSTERESIAQILDKSMILQQGREHEGYYDESQGKDLLPILHTLDSI